MESANLNGVAIMVAAFIAYVGGAIWYSPMLFSRQWQELAGVSSADAQGRAVLALIVQAVVTVIAAVVVAVVVSWAGAGNVLEGIGVGVLLGAGLVAADQAKQVVFERRPVGLFAINNGYTVLAFMVMGGIIAAWP